MLRIIPKCMKSGFANTPFPFLAPQEGVASVQFCIRGKKIGLNLPFSLQVSRTARVDDPPSLKLRKSCMKTPCFGTQVVE